MEIVCIHSFSLKQPQDFTRSQLEMRCGFSDEVFLRVYTLSNQVTFRFRQFQIATGTCSGLRCRVNRWHTRAHSSGNVMPLAFLSSLLFHNAVILERLRKQLPRSQKVRPQKEGWRIGEDNLLGLFFFFFLAVEMSLGPHKVIKAERTFIGMDFAADIILFLETAGNHCHAFS